MAIGDKFTLEQMKARRGLSTPKKIFTLDEIRDKQDLASRLKTTRLETEGQQFAPDAPVTREERITRGVQEGVGRFLGGGALAKGLGGALAAPGVQRVAEQEQRETETLQQTLLTRIREKREAGEDVSRLEKALRSSQDLATFLGDVQQDFAESLPSSKEVVGSALRLATTFGAGTIARGAAGITGVGKAVGVGAGAVRGAGAGALAGGAIGGLAGAGVGLEKDKDLSGVASSALVGAGGGALLGGFFGAIAGGISGRIRGKAVKAEDFAKDFVAPKETAKVRAEAIGRGELQDPSFFKKASLQASKRTKQLADATDDVISPKATVGQNIDAMRLKVSQVNSGVRDDVIRNNAIFNRNQLNSRLASGKDDLRLVFASDKTAERTYNAVQKEFMRGLNKNDIATLLERRQEFDKIPAIRKLLETEGLGENARREIVLAVRGKANQFVASLLPKGNTFKTDLLKQHHLLEALGNVSDKAVKIVGKNKLQLLVNEFPILKWVIGGFATGLVGAAGIGVGSAIVGSTD